MSSDTLPRPRKQSLNDVRAAIPAACYQSSNARGVLVLTQASILYLVPLMLLAFIETWWAVPVLWLAAGLAIGGLFVLGHDASHGALFRSRRINRFVARVCMVPSAHVEAAWNLGHNRIHHGYTARKGFDFVWHPITVENYQAMGKTARLRHRFEWSFAGAGAYYLRVVWWEKMWRFASTGKTASTIRRDRRLLGALLVAGVTASAAVGVMQGGWIEAAWLPIKLIVVPFLVFVQIIGWTVYVHHVAPDIRWWNRHEWSQFQGQMESTTILRFPRLINHLWFHNIFVHVPHHVDARIPYHQLPAAAAAIKQAYPDTVVERGFTLSRYLRAAQSCKLYDFDAGSWLRYSAVTS